MKQVYEISRRELLSIFSSPIGWLTLVIFTIQIVILVSGRLDFVLSEYERNGTVLDDYALKIFNGFGSLFGAISYYYYLYFPLLTMGLLSKEFADGGIKLLFSSPIRTHEIVLGKFFSVAIYSILMILIIVVLVFLIRIFVVDSFDYHTIFTGLFFMFLLMCLYASIGLFVSSITSYQLVAAVGTFATLFIMNTYIETLVQSHHPESIQLLATAWLGPTGHLELGYTGLVNSGAVLYFVILTSLFICLSYSRLRFMRSAYHIGIKSAIVISAIFITLLLGLITFNPNSFKYIDATSSKKYTASSEQQFYQSKLNEPIHLTRYVNVLTGPGSGSMAGFFGTARIAQRKRSRMKISPPVSIIPFYAPTDVLHMSLFREDRTFNDAATLNMQTSRRLNRSTEGWDLVELTQLAAEQNNWLKFDQILNPSQISEHIDYSNIKERSSYLLESGEYSTRLLRNGGTPSDQAFTTALKSMLYGTVKVGFVFGQNERNLLGDTESDYLSIYNRELAEYSLINSGFDFVPLDLKSEIPDNIDILLIADPSESYSVIQLQNIINHIESGRNLILVTSATNAGLWSDFITPFGLKLESRKSDEPYVKINKDVVINDDNDGFLFNRIMRYYFQKATLLKNDGDGDIVAIKDATGFSVSPNGKGFKAYPILLDGDQPIMVGLTRELSNRQQRIIISGDADFMSNSIEGIGYRSAFGRVTVNYPFIFSIYRWLSNDEFPVLVQRNEQLDKLIIRDATFLKLGMLFLLPLPFLITGFYVVYTRKRG